MLVIRPHHLIDIVASIGNGDKVAPHPYGHAVHTVTELVRANVDTEVRFVIGADDICKPCMHLVNGVCDDHLKQLDPPLPKQKYNDGLDTKLFELLSLGSDSMTVREFLLLVKRKLNGIGSICAHPKQDGGRKTANIRNGLRMLGV